MRKHDGPSPEEMVARLSTQMVEGAPAWARFQGAMKSAMVTPEKHAEIKQGVEALRRVVSANPNRRGPKAKKPSA